LGAAFLVGDVAVGFLGAGLAEFAASAHEDHRRSTSHTAHGFDAAAALAALSYPSGCSGDRRHLDQSIIDSVLFQKAKIAIIVELCVVSLDMKAMVLS